jgi:capsular polysaccharide biosynthesis protein
MTLMSILLVLRRRGWIAMLFAAIATLVMGAVTLRSKPSYTATATVIAKNPANATDRPLSFSDVVVSNTVAIRAIKSAHVQESVDQLETSLSVVAGKSDIYELAIRDVDPARATALANAVAHESTAYYQELAGGDTVSIQATITKNRADLNQRYLDASQALLAFNQTHSSASVGRDSGLGAQQLALQLAQQAAAQAVLNFEAGITQGELAQIATIRSFESHVLDEAAAIPSGGAKLTRVAYAGGLGLVLGLGLVFLLEYFGRAINKPEDAEAYLGAPVVGVIPSVSAGALRRAAGGK